MILILFLLYNFSVLSYNHGFIIESNFIIKNKFLNISDIKNKVNFKPLINQIDYLIEFMEKELEELKNKNTNKEMEDDIKNLVKLYTKIIDFVKLELFILSKIFVNLNFAYLDFNYLEPVNLRLKIEIEELKKIIINRSNSSDFQFKNSLFHWIYDYNNYL